MCLAGMQKVSSCTRHEAATAATDLCLLTPLNWEEQVASPVEVRTRRRRLVLVLEPVTGRRAQDIASVSLPLSAASASSPALAIAQACKAEAAQTVLTKLDHVRINKDSVSLPRDATSAWRCT